MMRRVGAAAILGILLIVAAGCGAAPKYTARQARIDLTHYVHGFNSESQVYDQCIVRFLFRGWSPEQVKTVVQGADFGEFGSAQTILSSAKDACVGSLPATGGCRDAAPTATTSPDAPKASTTESSRHTVYLNLHSPRTQTFTGTSAQIVVLPNPASINLGDFFTFDNESAGALTVRSVDYTQIQRTVTSVAPRSKGIVTCKYPTVPAWDAQGA